MLFFCLLSVGLKDNFDSFPRDKTRYHFSVTYFKNKLKVVAKGIH